MTWFWFVVACVTTGCFLATLFGASQQYDHLTRLLDQRDLTIERQAVEITRLKTHGSTPINRRVKAIHDEFARDLAKIRDLDEWREGRS